MREKATVVIASATGHRHVLTYYADMPCVAVYRLEWARSRGQMTDDEAAKVMRRMGELYRETHTPAAL